MLFSRKSREIGIEINIDNRSKIIIVYKFLVLVSLNVIKLAKEFYIPFQWHPLNRMKIQRRAVPHLYTDSPSS